MSPPRAFLRARCWRKAKNEIWLFWNGSIYWGKKNMNIYIWTSIRAIILWSLKALGQRVLALLSGNSFYSSGHRDLDIWSTDPKSIGFFYSIRAIILWSFKAQGLRVLELLSENGFHSSGHCDLDLWPTDPKINRGLQLNKSYHPMKFECLSLKGTRVIEGKLFSLFGSVTLTFDLLTPKSIGFLYSIRATTLWSLKALAQRVLKLLSGNGFHSSSHCDLDLWPTDPKINRGLLLNQGYHPMEFEGSGSKGTRVIERKRISLFGSLWPWPLTYWPQNHEDSLTQ